MVQSLERAFGLLELLDSLEDGGGVGLSQLGKELGLKLPTVHNILKTLVKLGYVEQDRASGKYLLSGKAALLGSRGKALKSLSEAGEYFARRVNAATGESVVLACYSCGMWRTLLHIDSQQPLAARGDLNYTENLYISATGRSILATLPEKDLKAYVARRGLPGEDWEGVGSEGALLAELAAMRERKLSLRRLGHVVALASPVLAPRRGLHAALGLYMPAVRFNPETEKSFARCLVDNAAALAAVLEN